MTANEYGISQEAVAVIELNTTMKSNTVAPYSGKYVGNFLLCLDSLTDNRLCPGVVLECYYSTTHIL